VPYVELLDTNTLYYWGAKAWVSQDREAVLETQISDLTQLNFSENRDLG